MRICFISHTSAKGGAERSLIELIDALIKRNIECRVLLPSGIGDGSLIDELEKRALIFDKFPYTWWMADTSSLWKRVARVSLNFIKSLLITAIIKQWKCDVIYTNTITIYIGALIAKLLKLPHVWHIHEFGYEDHGMVFDLGKKFSLWILNHLSSLCIVNSKAVAQKFLPYLLPSKLKIIYQSVNVLQDFSTKKSSSTQRISDTEVRCVIVGSLHKRKGQEDAILAINELVHMGINAKLLIIGDGVLQYRKHLYDLVLINKLDKHIKFAGYIENPILFMQDADIILVCSKCEAFGRVAIEAMKLGKPVIGTKSGGMVELINDGFNGLLYTPGNYKELAEKIRFLYNNPDILQQISKNGQQWATKQFTQNRYGDEVFALLKQLVSYS